MRFVRNIKIGASIATLAIGFTMASSAQTDSVQAEKVLKRTSDKLSRLTTLSYAYRRELKLDSEGVNDNKQIDSYLDLTSTDKIAGTRFQFDDLNSTYIFNGSEFFLLNKKNKTLRVWAKPKTDDLDRVAGLYDSPLMLRIVLPRIIADRSIPKTAIEKTIDNKKFYIVDFVLDGKLLSWNGGDIPVGPSMKMTYHLTIDAASYLPVEIFIGRIDGGVERTDGDFARSSFEYRSTNAPKPKEDSWYYSTYSKDYKPYKPLEERLIKVGENAPEWELKALKDDSLSSLTQYKGKVILLEFWIVNCGFCIAAIPKLNEIAERYDEKRFQIIGINARDPKENIEKFKRKNKSNYAIAYDGEATAEKYGVIAFPVVVLLDKAGKVIYSGAFDPAKTEHLEALIVNNL